MTRHITREIRAFVAIIESLIAAKVEARPVKAMRALGRRW